MRPWLAQAGTTSKPAIAAEGGAALEDQLNSADTLAKLGGSKWDFVVLQEQSQLPAVEAFRRVQMYPAARRLVAMIAATGARPMFFMTWGHRDGWPENGLPTYESMQAQVVIGYLTIARELNVSVAPVGSAWLTVTRNYSGLDLWQADGVHPSELGTYLAASVFYAAIFQRNPAGSTYLGTLPAATAQILQSVAGQTVLGTPGSGTCPDPNSGPQAGSGARRSGGGASGVGSTGRPARSTSRPLRRSWMSR